MRDAAWVASHLAQNGKVLAMRLAGWSVLLLTGALAVGTAAAEGDLVPSPVRKDLKSAVGGGEVNVLAPIPGFDGVGGGVLKKIVPTVPLSAEVALLTTRGKPVPGALLPPQLTVLDAQRAPAAKPVTSATGLDLAPNVLSWAAGTTQGLLTGGTLKKRALSVSNPFGDAKSLGLLGAAKLKRRQ